MNYYYTLGGIAIIGTSLGIISYSERIRNYFFKREYGYVTFTWNMSRFHAIIISFLTGFTLGYVCICVFHTTKYFIKQRYGN
jgi:hypothetical protein